MIKINTLDGVAAVKMRIPVVILKGYVLTQGSGGGRLVNRRRQRYMHGVAA
jgi:hypothetical protein